MTDVTANGDRDWTATVKTGTRGVVLVGYLAIALFAGGFGLWAATAPLGGAAIVTGIVAVAGRNQSVQHLEGGIIREIHVREGDRISAGDPLFTMDSTKARATLNALTKQSINLRARKTRLEAQRDGLERMAYDADFTALAGEYGLQGVLDEQRDEFDARLSRFKSEALILGQQVATAEETINGFEAQKKAVNAQLSVVNDETERKRKLLDQGLTNRSEYTALLRSQADLVGQIGAATSQIEQARSKIVEAREQLVRQETQRVEQSLGELSDVSAKISDVEEQINTARDILDRLVVRAPSDGLVIHLDQTTPGSVVRPGEELAQLLPTGSKLIVEAQLRPTDIDKVHLGQEARLRFVALNARTTPEVDGTVSYISPDRLLDQKSGKSFYVARLEIGDSLPEGFSRSQIYPGMPVEALISTGDRTFFEYLTRPLLDSFNRAFREE